MSIRLFRASRGTRRKKKRIPSLMVALAMMASAVGAIVLFATAQQASAVVDDFKPANWNMQGAQNSQDNKWQSGVRSLISQGHDVIALQEASQVPASAGHLNNLGNIVPGPAIDYRTFYSGLNNGRGWTPQRYEWRPNGSRGGVWYIYFLQTDFGANRVNLAIVTSHRADSVHVARPAFATSRPALGIRIGDTYFWTVHALSGGGNDARALLENIESASTSYDWAAMGDFNRDPGNLTVAQDMHIYRTHEATHYGGNGNNSELDYMVTGQVVPALTPGTTDLGSDHRAVFYYPLRAASDVVITMPSEDNATLVLSADGNTVVPSTDERDAYSKSWSIQEYPGTGYYSISSNRSGKCWDATGGILRLKKCLGSQYQEFAFDTFGDTGQIRVSPLTVRTCIGLDRSNPLASNDIDITLNCNAGSSRLDFRFDGDPGNSGAAVPVILMGKQPASTFTVAADGSAQFRTVQSAIDAVPTDGAPYSIVVNKGTYNEVITVPKNKPNLTIKGATGKAEDVVITAGRAHGLLKPDGTPYGTEGSATASFKAPNLRVEGLTITNSFNPSAHPEVGPYETQAVALSATGDRQVYTNVRLIGRQDTVLAKSPVATDQTRQYFRNVYVAGTVDFIFGNSTAVFDRSNIQLLAWPGGTITAPNTDQAKKYGILITNSNVFSSAAANTFYLGRPWHNTTTAQPQAVIRDSSLPAAITTAQPWTDMVPDYHWQSARFKEYHNGGAGAGVNSNRPQLTDAQAKDYTGAKYLAGTDGWNPIW
ncbi:pectinesterase family protein [Streptomyces sp. NPDC002143]